VIHLIYKILQGMACTRGAFTVVYPVVCGTGPLFTVIGAYFLFGEMFTLIQWLGWRFCWLVFLDWRSTI
jgi:multidrug transporter EmrE-like cation transporter